MLACMNSLHTLACSKISSLLITHATRITTHTCVNTDLNGPYAVLFSGYARGTIIQNCDFHEIGDNIIAQLGETEGAGDIAWGILPLLSNTSDA